MIGKIGRSSPLKGKLMDYKTDLSGKYTASCDDQGFLYISKVSDDSEE